jgi:hypothetical protein
MLVGYSRIGTRPNSNLDSAILITDVSQMVKSMKGSETHN